VIEVHVVIGQGGFNDGSLLDRAGLHIDAVFARREDAERYSTMGDMEVHTWTVAAAWGDDSAEVPPDLA
jgi:hypothetical protein